MPRIEREQNASQSQDVAGPSGKRRRGLERNNNTLNESYDTSTSEIVEITNNPASVGILEWITLKNFMCHDHLTFEFKPNINFVQGRNGSGKSAILSAVVVGLGGTSRLTNRGSSVKDLVKHGKQMATIEIAIKNSGKDAFRPEQYGDRIILERRICISGAGGYKLKSEKGTVVSTKKDDLMRILEHFNLQVDNPVTILNQDMSRSFLSTTDPKMLYKFFLKATQLQQMKDDYAQLGNAINSSTNIIERRRETLVDLEKEVEEQRSHYEFSISLNEKRKKLADLRSELIWAMVIQKEKEKEKAAKNLQDHINAMNKIKEKINTFQDNYNEETSQRKKNEDEFNKTTSELMSITKEVKHASEKLKKLKDVHKDKQSQYSVAEKKMRVIKKEIATLKAAIEKDSNEAQSQWAVARTEWQKNTNAVKMEMKELTDNMKTEDTHCQNLQHTLCLKKSEKTNLILEEKALRREFSRLERELKGLRSQKGSQVTVFGQWVPQLLKKIDIAFSRGEFLKKPVGPLGSFIELKDTKWGHVAEAVLGGRMTSFCVDNQKDEKTLRKLMKEVNFDYQPMPIVTVAKFRDKVHDVSRFETTCEYPSMWSVLNVTNVVAANTIIDQMQVESMLLIPTAQEAGRLLKDKANVPKNCKCAYTLNVDLYYPDPNYRLYSGRGQQSAKFLQVSVEEKIKEVMFNTEKCRVELNALTEQTESLQAEIKNLEEEVKASIRKSQQYKKKMDGLRMSLANLQNQETPPPPDHTQLEDDIKNQEDRLLEVEASMEALEKAVTESKICFTKANENFLELRTKEKEAYIEAGRLKEIVSEANARINRALSSVEAYKKKEKEFQKKERELQKLVKSTTEDLTNAMESAEQDKPRIDSKKSVEELERQYNSLQTRLNKEEANSGNPVAIAEHYKITKQRYKQVAEDLKNHTSLLKKLKESLNMREEKYKRFYKWLAIMVKYFFNEHLTVRKLRGSLNFNFDENTLNIHVEKEGNKGCSLEGSSVNSTDRSIRKKSGAMQKLSMMSGGERSFSTVSFIIALWQVIDSPIRILDEFDVFMDVIARNRAMKMMITAAKPGTQYIFLTPLSLDTNKLPNTVIFRMPDPERNDYNEEAQQSGQTQG